MALTLWTATHELFVELTPPIAARASTYHAHVTHLADNRPATGGTFAVVFSREGAEASRLEVDQVTREGVFSPRGKSPEAAGRYELSFVHRPPGDKEPVVWKAGTVELSDDKPSKLAEQAEGGVRLLKETQWRLGRDFSSALPRLQPMARALTLSATIQPDPQHAHTVLAPAAGAVLWATERTTSVIGMTVKRGQVLGRVLPAAASDHWSSLQLQIQRARIEKQRAEQTLGRVAALAAQGLVAQRRVIEGRAARDRANASLKAARLKVAQLRGRGAAPLSVTAPADGVLVEIHVSSGHRAAAGDVLAHVATPGYYLVRADLFSLDVPRVSTIRWARIEGAGIEGAGHRRAPIELTAKNSALLTERVVIDPDSLSAPLIYRLRDEGERLKAGEMAELTVGIGDTTKMLTVPRSAVVEINTRPYLFVIRTGESFERRRVRLGPADASRVAVIDGLRPADRVVTRGAFDVYAASLAGAVESHRH